MSETNLTRVGDLEVNQDLEAQERQWRFQRISAWTIAALAAAALLGAFGSGPFSEVAAGGPALRVTYDRFPRLNALTEIELELRSSAGATDVAISRDYLAGVRVVDIEPEPSASRTLPDRFVYTFEQEPPSLVLLRVEPQTFGPHSGTVYGSDDRPVDVFQFIYP